MTWQQYCHQALYILELILTVAILCVPGQRRAIDTSLPVQSCWRNLGPWEQRHQAPEGRIVYSSKVAGRTSFPSEEGWQEWDITIRVLWVRDRLQCELCTFLTWPRACSRVCLPSSATWLFLCSPLPHCMTSLCSPGHLLFQGTCPTSSAMLACVLILRKACVSSKKAIAAF